MVSEPSVSAASSTMNPAEKIGNAIVAEVEELIREQISDQIEKTVQASHDSLLKQLESYFGPNGVWWAS